MKKKLQIALGTLFLSLCSFPLGAMPSSGEGKGGSPNLFIPILLSFGVVYFLMIRPQHRREKEFQTKLKSIEKGDEVITKGGLIGKVTNVAEKILTIEISEKMRVKIDRTFVHHVDKPKS